MLRHLLSSGQTTVMTKRMTTDEFVAKARKVHGGRYDYSATAYVNNVTKVKIVCREHGVFEQRPANHLSGMGCLLCGLKNAGQYHKKNTESFIAQAKAIHGDRYDYSETEYKGAREKLTIICPKHGSFEQTAYTHLHGRGVGAGCERCSYEERGERARMSFEEFQRRANIIHHGAYDYSKTQNRFVDTFTKVSIICPEHGEFSQTPSGHLVGRGCPVCGLNRTAATLRKSNELFIRDAKAIHGNKYDYSEVEYKGSFEHVRIICPLDGVFLQSPTSHLSGIGCPKCSRRKQGAPRNLTRALRGEFDDTKDAFVYVLSFKLPLSEMPLYKIGSGTGSRMNTVINSIRHVGGYDITIHNLPFASTGEAIVFEHLAHNQVREHKFIVPVEFKFPGHSEVFTKPPVLDVLESHPTLERFRSGERWNINSNKANS